MSDSLMKIEKDGSIQFPEDYPFKGDVLSQGKSKRIGNGASVTIKRLTVTEHTYYFPTMYAKMYQNRAVLEYLTPEACKILIHIGYSIEYLHTRIQLTHTEVGISKYLFYKGILDLITNRIISKIDNKREWYWVNVAVLVVGNVHE